MNPIGQARRIRMINQIIENNQPQAITAKTRKDHVILLVLIFV